MSRSLFLVRLREGLRVRFDYDVRVERTKPHTIFPTRTQAEQFVHFHVPTDCNPFARDIEALYIDVGSQKIVINEDDDLLKWRCNWLDLVDAIQDAGAERPEIVWPEGWEPWWDTLTPEQQAKLRLSLKLPQWSENPFTMAEIYIERDFEMDYAVPLGLLDKLVAEWGCTLPVFREEEALEKNIELLVHWWEENTPQMAEAQKTAIWRLMDLQPFEIVEVPLA